MKRLILLLVVAGMHTTTYSQAGSPDLSFGNKGFIRTEFPSDDIFYYDNRAGDVLLNADGSFHLVIQMNGQVFITHRLANGRLDSSYGEKGYSVPVYMSGLKAVMQPDGKIIVGGATAAPGHVDDFGLARFTTDGLLDKSFSEDGVQTTDFTDWRDNINGLTLQADGKIVAVGSSYNNGPDKVAVARYLPDGSPDNSFSGDGKLTTSILGFDNASAVAMQADGKMVVVGSSYNNTSFVRSIAIFRYLPDGTLDNSFSGDGTQLIASGSESNGYAVRIQPDGKILVGGISWYYGYKGILIRLLTDGVPDPGFSYDGIVISSYGQTEAFNTSVSMQSDGKIITAGGAYINRYPQFAIARYNTDGSSDLGFSGDGIDIRKIGDDRPYSDGAASSLVITPGGKIMIAGTQSYQAFAVVRYQPDGSVDADFADNGILRDHKPGWYFSFNASAIQTDGKIVAAGGGGPPYSTPNYFLVARLNKDGTPDNSFSEDGKLMSNFGFTAGGAYAIAIQTDGKILLGGTASNGKDQDFAVVRLNADGTLDNSFSDDGKLLTDITGYNDEARAMNLQPDGKIVVGGFSNIWNLDYDFALARYNPDGSLDNTFSFDGKLNTNLFTARDFLNTMRLQPDGKIIAAGIANQDIGITRYHTDGSPDLSFDADGIVVTDIDGIGDKAYGAVLQGDGRFVIAGGTGSDFLLLRYNHDGSLDNSFSGDGKYLVDFGASGGYATSLAIQPDGKLIAGGRNAGYPADFALVRVNANGTADSSFFQAGKMVMDFGYGSDYLENIVIEGSRIYATGSTAYGGMMAVVVAYQLDGSNRPPVAGAWFQKYYSSTSALLAAWGSHDPDGGPITYLWEKTAGPEGSTLQYANSASPVVTGLVDGTYTFRLTVTDNQGATGTASLSFTVSTNLPPIAGAWLQKYYTPTSALLAAWDSHDPEGGPITYFWEKTAGPEGSTLLYGNSASPVVNGLVNGTYTYRLTVTDNQGATGWKELTFTVSGVPMSSNRSQSLIPADENANPNKAGQCFIYPNPVKDMLNFRWVNEYTGDAMVTVMDMFGRKIKDLRINKTTVHYNGSIELTGLKPGQYYLHIRNERKTFTNPFVKN